MSTKPTQDEQIQFEDACILDRTIVQCFKYCGISGSLGNRMVVMLCNEETSHYFAELRSLCTTIYYQPKPHTSPIKWLKR